MAQGPKKARTRRNNKLAEPDLACLRVFDFLGTYGVGTFFFLTMNALLYRAPLPHPGKIRGDARCSLWLQESSIKGLFPLETRFGRPATPE